MEFLNTPEKRKSFFITAGIMTVLLLIFGFVTILRELDPPPQGGIAVNLGTMDVGSGDIQPTQPIKTSPEPQPEPEPQETSPVTESAVTSETSEDVPVMDDQPTENQEPVEPVKEEPKPEKKPDPKPSKNVMDALKNATTGPTRDGSEEAGEGPGDGPGDKGNPDGDRFANTYYGDPGAGSGDKGYGLKGRSKIAGRGVAPDCNESGTVVVQIMVDRNGQVIQATPGKRGTTNNAQCLLDAAKKSAETFRFNREPDAPNTQVGFVEVIFKLGE